MNKLFWQTAKLAPVLFAAFLVAGNSASAQTVSAEKEVVNQTLEQIDSYQHLEQLEQNGLSQVTNVNQLRDVSPTDWAYEALRSLVDRYGCISGFPNQTYRGNQALSRYEFAAGLNSCLNQIERLIASQGSVSQEDLDSVNRLAQEFEAELATIGGRVDELESRTAVLEDNQFSTTTKLKGEVIFAIADTFGDIGGEDDPTETTFSDRVRLNFDSSFTGKDRLRTRLQAGNVPQFDESDTGVSLDSARLGFDADTGNSVEIDELIYRTRLYDDRITLYAGTDGLGLNDIFDVQNPVLASSGSGALSRFTRRNPILFRGTDGSGVGASVKLLDDKITFAGLYLAEGGESASPVEEEGIFNGSFSTGAQIVFEPTDAFSVGVAYVRSFQNAGDVDLTGDTGSDLAENPFFATVVDPETGETSIEDDNDVSADQVGLTASLDVGKFNFSVNGAVSFADELGTDNSATLYTASGSVSYLDFIKEGSALSLAGGVVPTVVDSDTEEDEDTPFLVEALYKFPVNDNISITPGGYVLFNPDGDSDNDEVYVGVIRTTFKF